MTKILTDLFELLPTAFITETGKWLSKAEIYGRVAHAAALLNQAVSQFIASRSKRPNRGFNHDLISFLDEMKENFCGYFPDLDAIDVRLNGQLFEKCMSLIASFANCCLDKEGEVVNFVKVIIFLSFKNWFHYTTEIPLFFSF